MPHRQKHLPMLVFLPGSGESSYRTNYRKLLGNTLEKHFSQQMALLYFDKPGIGQSTGEWWRQDFYQQAENVASAIRYVTRRFSINKARVGVIGHSQGGWLTQIAAARYPHDVRFGISLVGPAVSVLEQDVETYTSKYVCQGQDSTTAGRNALQQTYAEWLKAGQPRITDKDVLHYQLIKGYDPWQIIGQINVPFLFIYCENDELVYPRESLARINAIFNRQIPVNITVKVIPQANHSFRLQPKCFTGDRKSLPFAEELNVNLKQWLSTVLR